MEHNINIKRVKRLVRSRGAKAALVATLTVGAVVGGSQAAFADSYNYDYMPANSSGYYTSSDGGAHAGVGASGSNNPTDGIIMWHYNNLNQNDTVHVELRLADMLCDGDAAVAKVEFMQYDTVEETRAWIYTGGCGTSVIEHATFNSTTWDPFGYNGNMIQDSYGIRITICNGGQRGTDYNPGPFNFCGAAHGPFHH